MFRALAFSLLSLSPVFAFAHPGAANDLAHIAEHWALPVVALVIGIFVIRAALKK